jgi:hypothetical protein
MYFRKNLAKTLTLRTEHFSRRMQREKSITNSGEENRMVVESPETALKGHSHAYCLEGFILRKSCEIPYLGEASRLPQR